MADVESNTSDIAMDSRLRSLMAQEVNNPFAFLEGDEDGGKIIEAAGKAAVVVAAEKANQKQKQRPQEEENGNNELQSNWVVRSMKAKPIVLPRYMRRREIVFRKEKPEAQGQVGGSDVEYQVQNQSGSSNGYENIRAVENGNWDKNRGVDGYRRGKGERKGAPRYRENIGEADNYNRGFNRKGTNYRNSEGNRHNNDDNTYCRNANGNMGRYRGGNNNRRYYEGPDCYRGGSRGANSRSDQGRDNGFLGKFEEAHANQLIHEKDSSEHANGDGWQLPSWQRRRSKRFHKNIGHADGSEVGEGSQQFENQNHEGSGIEQVSEKPDEERPKGGDNVNGRKIRWGDEVEEASDVSEKDSSGDVQQASSEEKSDDDEIEHLGGDKAELVDADNSRSNGPERDDVLATADGQNDSKPSKKEKEKSKNKKLQAQDKSEKKDEREPDDRNKMTLQEYEKVQSGRKKALESMERTAERRASLDKDFELMQLVEKKVDYGNFIKLNYEKGTTHRRDSLTNKVRKSMSINEFLKPAEGKISKMSDGCGRQQRGEKPFVSRDNQRTNEGHGRNGERPNAGRGFNGERPNGGRGVNVERSNDRSQNEASKKNPNGGVKSKKPNPPHSERTDCRPIRIYACAAPAPAPAPAPSIEDLNQFPALGRAVQT